VLNSLKYILLPIVLLTFVFFYYQQPTNIKADIFKTLIATILGGLLTIFVNLNVSTYTSKKTSALERKKDIYIPINKELTQVINQNKKKSYWSSLNSKFEFPVIDELLESSHVFLPKNLEKNLRNLKSLVEEMNEIYHYPIAENIILDNFEEVLRHCYGEKGFERYENPDENIFHNEFPEPYHHMKHHLGNRKNVDQMVEGNYENIQLYESMLGRYDEPLLFELPDIYENRSIDIGEYVSEFFPVYDKIFEHEKIKLKREVYNDIIEEITNTLNQLRVIFETINKKFERDKY
jgi:hypothetical protein